MVAKHSPYSEMFENSTTVLSNSDPTKVENYNKLENLKCIAVILSEK
jgi:hypothetical protein